MYKISKWYLEKNKIVKKNFAREWLINCDKEKVTVITSPSAWNYFKNSCSIPSNNVIINPSLEVEDLDNLCNSISSEIIVGVGAGRIMDISKYIARRLNKVKKQKCQLILIPSILSTTSWANFGIAVRKNNELLMAGNINPKMVIVDPEYIASAPGNLSINGIVDLMVPITALSDWKLEKELKGGKYSVKAEIAYKNLINEILTLTPKFNPFTMESVEIIYDIFMRALAICGAAMSDRPLEGSEHFLYYAIDELDDRKWIHGEIIALTLMISNHIHNSENRVTILDNDELIKFFDENQIKFRPKDLKLKLDDITKIIQNMNNFVKKNKYHFTIWNYLDFKENSKIIDDLDNKLANLNKV